MAIAKVQADWDTKSGSFTQHQYASGLTLAQHNLVEMILVCSSAGVTAPTISDSHGNTYILVDAASPAGGVVRTYYVKDMVGGAGYTITIDYAETVTVSFFGFRELSGAHLTAPLAGHVINVQAAPGTGTNAVTSTAITPSASNCWISGLASGAFVKSSATAGTGFAADTDIGIAGTSLFVESLTQGAAASIAATMTLSAGTDTAMALLAWKVPGGGAFSLALDGSSYGVTGADITPLQSSPLTWLRVGR